MAKTPSYKVDYNDPRFAEVKAEEKATTKEYVGNYDKMINQSDKYFDKQIDAAQDYADKQQQLQQERTDFTIDTIEQQKQQAEQDYLKEQSGAYVDWKKQSDRYGVNAEQMAANGLDQSGYSESAQVSMYNTYQNRVATARESYNRAVLNYDNAIKEAQLQNSSILAEIAYNALQTQLQLSLQGFQYKNQLITDKMNTKLKINEMYHTRYQDVLQQINTENSMAEQVRQFNERMAEDKRQYNESLKVSKANLKLEQDKFKYQKDQDAAAKAAIQKGGSGGSGGSSGKKTTKKTTKTTTVKKGVKSTGGKATTKTTTKKSAKTENVPLDTKSILSLGRGPINAKEIVRLENAGVITSYVEDGKRKFKYVFKQ